MEVSVTPYKRISIKGYMKYDTVEDLLTAVTLSFPSGGGGRIGGLFWANGVLFRHFPYPPSNNLLTEYLKGHLPLDHVDFASMPEFRKEIPFGHFVVAVLDVSNHIILNELAKWIGNNLLVKKSKPKK